MTRTFPALLLALALAACSSQPAADAGADAPAGAATGTDSQAADTPPAASTACNAEAAHTAIGQPASDAVVKQARVDAGAEITRVIHPGQPVTMDYRAERLNIEVDADNVVTVLRCG